MTTGLVAERLTEARPGTGTAALRRILMTADAVGGVWRYSVDLSRAFAARGIGTTLVVLGPPPSPAQQHEARRAGVPLLHAPFRLEWMDGGVDDVHAAGRWLLSLERDLRPDVVHLNGYAHAALRWAAPVVVVAHSCIRTWWRAVHGEAAPATHDQYAAAVSRGLRNARAVVAPSRAMLEGLGTEYAAPIDGVVIPNGCRPCRGTGRRPKENLVLAAGRAWDEAKNIAALCAVAPRLTWPVAVAGDTQAPDGTACPLPDVHALGLVPGRAMRSLYERAAIYALPARYEPFGLSVLEAARAGCALVLGDIPSLRENWHDAAVFVPPDDRERLAAAIQALIDAPDERQAMSQRARRRARRFTIGRTADAYVHLYEGVIA